MSKSWLLVIALLVSLVGCKPETPIETEAEGQICPEWADYTAERCKILFLKVSFSWGRDISLGDYEKVRMTIAGGEVLFDKSENIVVYNDTGEKVDYETLRLQPSTYIIEKQDKDSPATFYVKDAFKSSITISAEFVRPQE